MGTPEFAVPALKALNQYDYDVDLVVTQPDRPKGRGRKPVFPPVKKAAIELGYEVIQPVSIKTGEFSDRIENLKPDLFVVVAFGNILPENLLALPRMGAINIHASLLPKYRGPSPIHQAIINGEKESGVTIMFIDKGLDTGDILLSAKEKITSDNTSSTLHDRLTILGADLLIKALNGLESGTIKPVPQDHTQSSYAPLLKKKDGHINWNLPAGTIESFIRGMTPWPGAFTFFDKKRLKIFKAESKEMNLDDSPGTVIKGFPDELCVATGDGALCILEIQGASGKRLSVKDFLRGCKIPQGTTLTRH